MGVASHGRHNSRAITLQRTTSAEGVAMGLSVSLIVLIVGVVLLAATSANTISWIIVGVGAAGLLFSLMFWSTWGGFGDRRRETVGQK